MVKPPALYRSPLFSLGLFVLVFLLWVWVDSRTAETSFTQTLRFNDGDPVSLGITNGAVLNRGEITYYRMRVTKLDPRLRMVRTPYGFGRVATKKGGAWFPRPRVMRYEQSILKLDKVSRDVVEIPMWLLVGIYIVLWGGVMWWRRRRWWRLAEGASVIESAA